MVSDGQTVHFWPHSVIHNRKAVHLTSLKLWWEVNFRPPLKRQNFRDAYGLNCYPHPISCHMRKFQRASSHEQEEQDGRCESWEDAVPEVGRRVSWVAPASTSNFTGYPGDLKCRCDRFYPNFYSIWRPRFGIWSANWLTCLWPGWRYPARQWPGPGSWRGGELPGRWSPGGWRSSGGKGPSSSISRFQFQTSLHLVDVRDALREAEDLVSIAGNARIWIFDCWTPVWGVSLSLYIFFLCLFLCQYLQCLIRIQADWKYSPCWNSNVEEPLIAV